MLWLKSIMEIIWYVVKRLEILEDVEECVVLKENLFCLFLLFFLFIEKVFKVVISFIIE